MDSGADRDVISEKLVKRLQLRSRTTILKVITVGSEVTSERDLADFMIESLDSSYSAEIEDALVGDVLTSEYDLPPHQRDLSAFHHLRDVSFPQIDAEITVIIGAAHTTAWTPTEVRRGKKDELIASNSSFGWYVSGKMGKRQSDAITLNAIATDNVNLKEDLDRIFYHDFPIVSEEEIGESRENHEAIQQLADSIRFDEKTGKYFVGLPWHFPRDQIAAILRGLDSRQMAMRRLKSMIPKFRRDPEKRDRVFKEMDKFTESGVAVEVDSFNDDKTTPFLRWHLPLLVVEKRGKTRVCHDARASVKGTCLNELLLGGPNLVNPLAEILMFFRKFRRVFMTDIKAYYHQVRVDPRDVQAFRYPWFADKEMKSAVMMSFLAHVFGSAASSIATSFVLRHHAERVKDRYPENVYDMIRRRFYVDDGSGGANTPEEMINLVSNVTAAMAEGGFELCKFKSNLPGFLGEDPNAEVQLGDRSEELTKVLGVSWIPSSDVFTFNYDSEIAEKSVHTPRELVSIQASLYDPLGLISPFQLHGRQMLQRADPGKNGWDSSLDVKLRQDFERWSSSIPFLARNQIPRWWGIEPDEIVQDQFHVFADAAATGYGAVAYRRQEAKKWRGQSNNHVCSFSRRSH